MADIDITPPLICKSMAIPPIPVLPSGITLEAVIPGIGHVFDIKLCCKIFQIPLVLPPIPLGIALTVPVLVQINTLINSVNTYLRSIPSLCPRER